MSFTTEDGTSTGKGRFVSLTGLNGVGKPQPTSRLPFTSFTDRALSTSVSRGLLDWTRIRSTILSRTGVAEYSLYEVTFWDDPSYVTGQFRRSSGCIVFSFYSCLNLLV